MEHEKYVKHSRVNRRLTGEYEIVIREKIIQLGSDIKTSKRDQIF